MPRYRRRAPHRFPTRGSALPVRPVVVAISVAICIGGAIIGCDPDSRRDAKSRPFLGLAAESRLLVDVESCRAALQCNSRNPECVALRMWAASLLSRDHGLHAEAIPHLLRLMRIGPAGFSKLPRTTVQCDYVGMPMSRSIHLPNSNYDEAVATLRSLEDSGFVPAGTSTEMLLDSLLARPSEGEWDDDALTVGLQAQRSRWFRKSMPDSATQTRIRAKLHALRGIRDAASVEHFRKVQAISLAL